MPKAGIQVLMFGRLKCSVADVQEPVLGDTISTLKQKYTATRIASISLLINHQRFGNLY